MEPFPRSEYLVRHQRAFELMERDGFNALVVTTESNFTYFTGIQTPSFASRSRPIALILAPASEPLIIVAKSHVPHARRSGVAEVLGFDGFEPEGLAVMRDALRSMVPSGGRVGCEFGHEMHVGLTHVGLHDLMTQLSGLQFEDASGLIWDLRLTKSEAETQMLREIGRITGLAYDALIAIARPNVSLRDLFEEFASTLIRHGADRVGYFAIHAGKGDDRRPNAPPSQQRLSSGDVVWIDAGGVMSGYWSDFTRMLAIGDPGTNRRDAYAFVYRSSRELLSLLRPGMAAAEVMAACRDIFARGNRQIGNSTRIGHGLGLDITEPPSLFADDDRLLTDHMVLAIEPGLADDSGYFVVEENVELVKGGRQLLSPPAPEHLPIVE